MTDRLSRRTRRPSAGSLSRRAALNRLGGAGASVLLATPAIRAAAQDATPAGTLPPVVQEYVDAWAVIDLDRLGAILAEDVVYTEIATGMVFEGRDAVIGHYQEFLGAFSDLAFEYGAVFSDGVSAAGEWTFGGRYTTQLPGLPPAEGQAFTVQGVDILELEGDAIAAIREYGNLFGLLVQIGAFGEMMEEGGEATPAG